jgi:hypothetical protein
MRGRRKTSNKTAIVMPGGDAIDRMNYVQDSAAVGGLFRVLPKNSRGVPSREIAPLHFSVVILLLVARQA